MCIHDGARPFVSTDLIESTIRACIIFDGAVAAVKATDTVKLVTRGSRVQKTLNRNKIWLAQTPQTFKKKELIKALLSAQKKNIFRNYLNNLSNKYNIRIHYLSINDQIKFLKER